MNLGYVPAIRKRPSAGTPLRAAQPAWCRAWLIWQMLTGAAQVLLSVAARQDMLQCWTILLLSLNQMMFFRHSFHFVRTLTAAEPPCCAARSDLPWQGLRDEVGHIIPAWLCCWC